MNFLPFVVSASALLAGPGFPLDGGFGLQIQLGAHMESCSPESWPYNWNNYYTALDSSSYFFVDVQTQPWVRRAFLRTNSFLRYFLTLQVQTCSQKALISSTKNSCQNLDWGKRNISHTAVVLVCLTLKIQGQWTTLTRDNTIHL